jgi:flagellar basal body-associated protein FliL
MADKEREETTEETTEETVGKGGINKLLMAAILIVGLGIGGGGAFFFLSKSDTNHEGDVEEVEIEAVVEEEEVELTEFKFVLFEGMAVPIHDSRGKYVGNYKITIKVLTKSDNNNVRVKNVRFELRQAFISRIAKGGFLMPNSTNLDYEKTANVLKEIAKDITGDTFVEGVTIEDAMRVNN